MVTTMSENGTGPRPSGPPVATESASLVGKAELRSAGGGDRPRPAREAPDAWRSGEVHRQLADVPLRPYGPLYRPSWSARTFGWIGDLVARLDPAPLGRVFRSGTGPAVEAFGRMMEIPAAWIEAFTRKGRIGRVGSAVSTRVGLTLVPVARAMEGVARVLARGHGSFARSMEHGLGRLPLPRWVKEVLWLSPAPRSSAAGTVQSRMKAMYPPVVWTSVIVSVAAHALAFGYAPTFEAEDLSFEAVELTAVEMPPEIEIPPPPAAIARPAIPVASAVPVDEDITIAPTTFADNPVEDLPPPPTETASSGGDDPDISSAPTFTPFTVAPEIRNVEEIVRVISEVYPATLRDAGIGGVVVVWFLIDEEGRVTDARVAQSSGYAQLDAAALQASDQFVFSPAILNDRVVPVWVQFPITFAVR